MDLRNLKHRWEDIAPDHPLPLIDRRRIMAERMMVANVTLYRGFKLPTHSHENEQVAIVVSGRVRFVVGDAGETVEHVLVGGEVLHLPANVPHAAEALEDTVVVDCFSPAAASTGLDTAARG